MMDVRRASTIAPNDSDVALMLRVQRDEPGAFAELVGAFQSRIFARLCQCLSDRHLAEDLTQDVFLRIFRNRKRYEPRARFTTWLFHIVQNVARNSLRSKKRHAWLRYGVLEQTETHHPERFCVHDDGVRLERQEDARKIRTGLDALLDRQRLALELQHFHGHSYPEIGRVLSLSTKAAKSLLYRARLELREKLAELISEA